MDKQPYDIAIIGGGINGAGIARDAAGRGLRVLLVEKGDLAQGTSSASSKLVHGGLRYLEQYEFRLVRESLREREILMGIAPHIIWPMDFILPHSSDMRPAWMLRAGLLMYDTLAPRKTLHASQEVGLAGKGAYGQPLQQRYAKGFRYTDCWVDDARLVVLNARDAADHGADIRTRTTCINAEHSSSGGWRVLLQAESGQRIEEKAKILVNAAGPWVNDMIARIGVRTKGRVRLVKGSHIVVPRLYEGNHAYILQFADKRVVFIMPFQEAFSLIGTTDIGYDGDPAEAAISEEEIRYLLGGVNSYLATLLTREQVVWSYSGVRALYDDASENLSTITRDYVLELDVAEGAPLLTIFGGKITTYRKLAEQAMEKLHPYIPSGAHGSWTANKPLPGGESYTLPTWLATELATRWQRQYGSCVADIIDGAETMSDLGEEIVPDIYEAELRYAKNYEWAKTANDFLWRRTKQGLDLDAAQTESIAAWFRKK